MKILKTAICVILSFMLIFSVTVPVFAQPVECSCGKTPVISVTGINHVPLVNGYGQQVFAPDTSAIAKAILRLIPDMTRYLIESNTSNIQLQKSAAIDFIYRVVNEVKPIFEPIKCDEKGNSVDQKVGINRFFPESMDKYNYEVKEKGSVDSLSEKLGEAIGGSHVFVFTYDWRLDMNTLAQKLNEFVESVKRQTGHSKVTINGQSMGTCVVQAYLERYGYDDVETVAMLSGAYMGLDMVGELFKGNVTVDENALSDLLVQMVEGSPDAETKNEILRQKDLFKRVIKRLDPVLKYESVKGIAYYELFVPYFGFIPSLWAFVPNEDFEQAYEYMFKKHKPHKELEEKIMSYHNDVALKMEKRIEEMDSDGGVKYYCVSHYNRQMLPVSPDSSLNSDGVIETVRTSGGAVVADRGKSLPENYKQVGSCGHNHISPDRIIDASCCLAPTHTWFVKNLDHVQYNENTSPFFVYLLTSENQVSVFDNPIYPQFMRYNREAGHLSPFLNEYGDTNQDGEINLIDARNALKYSRGADKNEAFLLLADEDGNGIIEKEEILSVMKKYNP